MNELEYNIYKDIQLEIQKYYKCNKVEYRSDETPQDTIINFFSYLYRLIPNVKRNVHYSEELQNRINAGEISKEYVKILERYKDAFLSGEDMNIFLSNKIKKSRETDFLRYTWQLFHLHLSGKFVEDKGQMKNNRSNTQLLCIINAEDVYFIDIIPHPMHPEDYFDIRILEIIQGNGWMEKIGFYEANDIIPGTMEPKIESSADIFKLYSFNSMNIGFEFGGKCYLPTQPLNSARRPWVATRMLTSMSRNIYKLNHVDGKYIGFCMSGDARGVLRGVAEFELINGERVHYCIF